MTAPKTWSFRAWAAVVLILFAAIVVLPVAQGFWTSLQTEEGISLAAYRGVLGEARQWRLLTNTLTIAAGAAALAGALGVAAGFAIEYCRVPTRRILMYAVAIPFLIPPYVSAIAWIDLLAANGLLHRLLRHLLGLDVPLPSLNSRAGVIVVLGLAYYPVVALTTGLALRRFDRRLEEAARLVASAPRTLGRVVFPLLAPSIAAGALVAFLLALLGFSAPSLLQVNTYPVESFTLFNAFYDFSAATAHALPLLFCGAGALSLGVLYIGPRRAWLTGAARPATSTEQPALSLPRWARPIAALGVWLLVAVSAAAPLAVLVWRSMPLASYIEVLKTTREEIVTSLLIGAGSATFITILAMSLGYLGRTRALLGRLRVLSLVSFLVSGPVLAIALIATWNRPGIASWVYDSVLVVVLACTARFLFFAQCGFEAALGDIDGRLEEAAFVAGVVWWRRATGILFPLLWPVVAGIWGLSFIFAMGELDTAVLLAPPGRTPLPVRIFSLMHYGPGPQVAALNVTTSAVILLCAALTAALYTWGRKRRHAPR